MEQLAYLMGWLAGRPLIFAAWLLGWRVQGPKPEVDKFVAIGAPHTTGWDYFIFLLASAILVRRPRVMIKTEALGGPIGALMKWGGAIPIDRSRSHNMVDAGIAAINAVDRVVWAVAPEGTRRKTDHWKTGFYHIAMGANMPIVMFAPNYRDKRVFMSEVFQPTGDIEADFAHFRAFFEQYGYGKYHENASAVYPRQPVPNSGSETA